MNVCQLGKNGQGALGFFGVDQAQGVADVDDYVVVETSLGYQRQGDVLADTAQVDRGRIVFAKGDDAGGDG